MSILFCAPTMTMMYTADADKFLEYCRDILDTYINEITYISSECKVNSLLSKEADKDDIFIFFNSEYGKYSDQFKRLITKFSEAKCRIWPIAMENNAECRKPPEPVYEMQSFDVSCRKENRNPMKNNMKAIAQIFARKIIAQIQSPLYRDEVLYFISHRRADGEHIAAKLYDKLKLLTRERNVYRDVVNVEVGNDAQEDIDKNLANSDVLIFLQTEQAQYSSYIMKELCFALVNDIPVLWIQIDNASYSNMKIRPGEKPVLCYMSSEFDDEKKLEEIADEIEEKCFQLIMYSSNQIYSYIECLNEMKTSNKIDLVPDKRSMLAYSIKYIEETRDKYSSGEHTHYIQCYGRNPHDQDIEKFIERAKKEKKYDAYEKFLILSNHAVTYSNHSDPKFVGEIYDNYLANIENTLRNCRHKLNKRIIISGAFPDNDEIYKISLIEALMVYCREIIRRGYTLVFGAHPTFQELIFETGRLYSDDVKYSIEMHMERAYINLYNQADLERQCTLVLSDGLQEMRESMICREKSKLMICLGGKIKEDKSQQGVDIEVELAKRAGIPVALVGTVGGRSSEYAHEMLTAESWSELNDFDKSLNESLFCNVNHRLTAKKLLDSIEKQGAKDD